MRNAILSTIFCLCLAALMCGGTTPELRTTMGIICISIFAWYFSKTLIQERDKIFIEQDDDNEI